MREIIFRGKNDFTNEWYYGYLMNKPQYGLCIEFVDEKDVQNNIVVNPNTIGQFTGLTDKNGQQIFEGDIVKTQMCYDRPHSAKRKGKHLTGVVEYCIGAGKGFYNKETQKFDAYKCYSASWTVKIIDKDSQLQYGYSDWGPFYDCEVVGNIHDNPDLLKQKEDHV